MNKKVQKVLVVPAEVYSRVSGYFRPVNQWNKGKREEFAERKKADPKEIDLGQNC